MFWDIFCKECDKLNKKPNKIASELGLSGATTTKWKSGAIPNGETLVKLAKYFGCSIDYLLGITEDSTPERRIFIKETIKPSPEPVKDTIIDQFIKLFKELPLADQIEVMSFTMQKVKKEAQ